MYADNHEQDCMRYLDGEMSPDERRRFEIHIASCDSCRKTCRDFARLKEVTDSVRIADLPQTVWDVYWNKVYNRIERSVAWFLFIIGTLIVNGYWLYKAITDPGLYNILGLGLTLMLAGLAVLFLSVLREKATVNKTDRYIREVKR
jgi:predicted anti-sigma-YlaC factor YlaD